MPVFTRVDPDLFVLQVELNVFQYLHYTEFNNNKKSFNIYVAKNFIRLIRIRFSSSLDSDQVKIPRIKISSKIGVDPEPVLLRVGSGLNSTRVRPSRFSFLHLALAKLNIMAVNEL